MRSRNPTIFLEHRSHREACELAVIMNGIGATAADVGRALREAHRAALTGAVGTRARPVAKAPSEIKSDQIGRSRQNATYRIFMTTKIAVTVTTITPATIAAA